jgi:hypothetical protein
MMARGQPMRSRRARSGVRSASTFPSVTMCQNVALFASNAGWCFKPRRRPRKLGRVLAMPKSRWKIACARSTVPG